MDKKVSNFIAYTVTVVWALSFIADIALGSKYDPPASIHAVMMVVAGAAFTNSIVKKGP